MDTSKTLASAEESAYGTSKDVDTSTVTSLREVVDIVANNLSLSQCPSIVHDDEFKLDVGPSLVLMILQNVLLQVSFFSIVSSSASYAEYLGGTATFSGLVIGIPTAVSGLALIPLVRYDKGTYALALNITCFNMLLGSILYALAYKASFLYLILMGRMIQGCGFVGFLYTKRYCTDTRIVGIRRRTTLAGWLVLGQGLGMSAGPFLGGMLYRVGFGGKGGQVWNGYTAPGWVMAAIWAMYWAAVKRWFVDVPPRETSIELAELPSSSPSPTRRHKSPGLLGPIHELGLSGRQWGVVATMCWFAMTCFFILGAWESNIPVFTASSSSTSARDFSSLFGRSYPFRPFSMSPTSSGNFIALGGIAILPFLILNLLLARRTQDRHILALGSALGLAGLLITIILLRLQTKLGVMKYGSFFACWFLVALGFNLASTCTLSLLSKQMPARLNGWTSFAIQYSNYTGRVTGAVWGGSGVHVGMLSYVGLEIALIGIGAVMFMTLWRELKAKTG